MKNDKMLTTFREKGLKLCREKLKNFPHLTIVESTFGLKVTTIDQEKIIKKDIFNI